MLPGHKYTFAVFPQEYLNSSSIYYKGAGQDLLWLPLQYDAQSFQW